jgi:hypothetical protein
MLPKPDSDDKQLAPQSLPSSKIPARRGYI